MPTGWSRQGSDFDPYRILGVSPTASLEEIRRAYAALVRRFPPLHAPERFQEVRRAYEILSDPDRREQYDVYFRYREATSMMKRGEWQGAIRALKLVLAIQPDLDEARFLLGMCFLHLEEHAEAVRTFQVLTKRAPDNPYGWLGLGQSLFSQGLHDDDWELLEVAAEAFELAACLDSHLWFASYEAAKVHLLLGNYDQAADLAEDALEAAREPDERRKSLLLICQIYCASNKRNWEAELGGRIRDLWRSDPEFLSEMSALLAFHAAAMVKEGRWQCAKSLTAVASFLDAKHR